MTPALRAAETGRFWGLRDQTNLAKKKMVRIGSNERPCLKKWVESDIGRHLMLTSGICMDVHTQVSTSTHRHVYTHTK